MTKRRHRTTRLQGDLIILGRAPQLSHLEMPDLSKHPSPSLPAETGAARYSFSHALARSTSLSALEESLDDYLSSVSGLPLVLSKTGKPGLERKELIMKLGQLLRLRQRLNLTAESYDDTPDFYWTEPALEGTCFLRSTSRLSSEQLTRSLLFLISVLQLCQQGIRDQDADEAG